MMEDLPTSTTEAARDEQDHSGPSVPGWVKPVLLTIVGVWAFGTLLLALAWMGV